MAACTGLLRLAPAAAAAALPRNFRRFTSRIVDTSHHCLGCRMACPMSCQDLAAV
jgi:hypothetical protein